MQVAHGLQLVVSQGCIPGGPTGVGISCTLSFGGRPQFPTLGLPRMRSPDPHMVRCLVTSPVLWEGLCRTWILGGGHCWGILDTGHFRHFEG